MEPLQHVATKEDLVKIKNALKETDAIEACTKERANTKSEILQTPKFDCFCCSSQRRSHGV